MKLPYLHVGPVLHLLLQYIYSNIILCNVINIHPEWHVSPVWLSAELSCPKSDVIENKYVLSDSLSTWIRYAPETFTVE